MKANIMPFGIKDEDLLVVVEHREQDLLKESRCVSYALRKVLLNHQIVDQFKAKTINRLQ